MAIALEENPSPTDVTVSQDKLSQNAVVCSTEDVLFYCPDDSWQKKCAHLRCTFKAEQVL